MPTTSIDVSPELKQSAKRFGYVIAIGINLVMFFVVQNILEWGWLPFLTEEFAEVVPWISFSLIVSIAANLVYQVDDSPTVKSLGQIVVNLISIQVTFVMLTVFPFDFSASQFDWEPVTRLVLILAIVGAGVGAIVEGVKLLSRRSGNSRNDPQ